MNIERALTPRPANGLTGPEGGAFPPPDAAGASTSQKVHRLLRGRYRWAVLLAVIFTVAGGYFGWTLASPVYRSEAQIYVSPTVPSRRAPDGKAILPMFEGFISAQVAVIQGERVINQAMSSKEWTALGRSVSPEATERFRESVTVQRARGTQHINVYFSDEDPRAAQIGAKAVINAYRAIANELKILDDDKQLEYVRNQIDLWSGKVSEAQKYILDLTADWGGREALDLRYSGHLDRLLKINEALQNVDRQLASLRGGPDGSGSALSKFVDRTPEEIALENENMATILIDLRIARAKVSTLRADGYGDNHPDLVSALANVAALERARDEFAVAWNRTKREEIAAVSDQKRLEGEKEALTRSLKSLEKEMMRLGKIRREVEIKAAERDHAMVQLDMTRSHLAQLNYAAVGKGRIKVISEGILPGLPYQDKRKQLAVLFGLLGAMLGVLLVLGLGYVDGRMRDSGDLRGWLGNRTVLGLIPDLDDDAKEQVDEELALHCVQRIRTSVEIEFLPADLRALCVTGPNAGAGKSTLTLALGAALCAARAKTLLIDFDLSGKGLTRKVVSYMLHQIRHTLDASATAGRETGNGKHPELADLIGAGRGSESLFSKIRDLVGDVLRRADITTREGQCVVNQIVNVLNLGLSDRELSKVRAEDGDSLMALGCMWDEGRESFVSTWADPKKPSVEGGSEAADISPYVIETGIPDLDFLRLGGRHRQTPVELSNASVAALIAAARELYPIVLIDTGPILGSLESSFVATQSDVVILAVLRGEQRHLTKKAIAYLEEIGANLGGLVLNRATVKDARITSYTYSYYASRGRGAE